MTEVGRPEPRAEVHQQDPELLLHGNTGKNLWQLHYKHDENEDQRSEQSHGAADSDDTAENDKYATDLYQEMSQSYNQDENATFITLPGEGIFMRYLKIKFFRLANTWRNHALHAVSLQGIGDYDDVRILRSGGTRGLSQAFAKANTL